jgi:hypothetical protein
MGLISVFVKFMYLDYMDDHTKFLRKYIWKIKVSLKSRIFIWFLHHKDLLTKNNLAKRKQRKDVTSVIFVIKRRRFNIYLYHVLWQKWFGKLCTWPLILLDGTPRVAAGLMRDICLKLDTLILGKNM